MKAKQQQQQKEQPAETHFFVRIKEEEEKQEEASSKLERNQEQIRHMVIDERRNTLESEDQYSTSRRHPKAKSKTETKKFEPIASYFLLFTLQFSNSRG